MAFFRRQKVAPDDLLELREWVVSRGATNGGVEAYVEPPTSFSPTTVVLVAGDGEFVRRKIGSPHAAVKFARSVGIPIYHTDRIGLPQRMRDYAVRQQAGTGSAGATSASPVRSPQQEDALRTLAAAASVDVPGPRADRAALVALLRAARAKAHPDRNGGDRTRWDAVEEAAHILGLR